ncbi:MAG TPA: 50S ribosomal protein L1, partial [Patescibacteria group bacterium]|nr:50S ribosomal protein L1 [Patescibacteria group bacterium]
MAHSKRFKELKAMIDPKKSYTPEEAVELAKKTATTKFDSAVEVHVRLGIDPKKSEQSVRGTVALPHGTGKAKKVAAFVS